LETNPTLGGVMKYTEQFKLAAITAYLEGSDGFRKVAQHFNIDFSLLRRWVASYKARSTISSIPHSQRYHIDFKRRVVQHMREHRLSLRQTAAHFGLGQSSRIGIWEDQYYSGNLASSASQRKKPTDVSKKIKPLKPTDTDDALKPRDQLMAELEYLRMENAVLKELKALREEKERRQEKKR
ncbi:transposase, partial [Pseudomonas putida]